MLAPYLSYLDKLNIYLASASPTRKDLFDKMNLKCTVVKSNFDEENYSSLESRIYVAKTAEGKADSAFQLIAPENKDIIVSADTIVDFEGDIIGKPINYDDAFQTLTKLSGKQCTVISGVCIGYYCGSKWEKEIFTDETAVYMGDLSPRVIDEYIKTGDAYGRCGSFGLQAGAFTMVRSIEGNFYNVAGFPVYLFCQKLIDIIRKKFEI